MFGLGIRGGANIVILNGGGMSTIDPLAGVNRQPQWRLTGGGGAAVGSLMGP